MTDDEKLARYKSLLLTWTAKVNLIGPETRRNLDAHIQEALEASLILQPAGDVLDFGSGGGLPAIPMAIRAGSAARFHLVESDARKWSFLKYVSRDCALNCQIHGDRLADVVRTLPPELHFDLITSRAVGHPSKWLPLLRERLSREGRVALFQGSPTVEPVEGFRVAAVERLSRGDSNFLVTLRAVPRGTSWPKS